MNTYVSQVISCLLFSDQNFVRISRLVIRITYSVRDVLLDFITVVFGEDNLRRSSLFNILPPPIASYLFHINVPQKMWNEVECLYFCI